jgi:hypothetical protein
MKESLVGSDADAATARYLTESRATMAERIDHAPTALAERN